jgi:flagellar biosynthesis protein FlhG
MSDDRPYASLALVSGKGGVGKTTLAANISWLISAAPSRVLLVDLDFQNLGSTGLFASRYTLHQSNARELLRSDVSYDQVQVPPSVTHVTEHLAFLPAALLVDTLEERDAYLGDPKEISAKLGALLSALHRWYNFDCFVLDCHGGVDAVSIAAAGMCNHTLVVTEADTVSFAGTLGLVDRYYEHYSDIGGSPRIEYIVNRIPSKYKWKDLNRLYGHYVEVHLGRFTPSDAALLFVPAEEYLADSFGEYPFQVELVPSAIFSRKLELLVYRLVRQSHPQLLSKRTLSRFRRPRQVRKVERLVLSREARNLRTAVTAFALSSSFFVILLPVYVLMTLPIEVVPTVAAGTLVWVFGVLAGLITLYFILAAFRVLQFFREKFRFNKALWRVLPKEERTVWRRISLWKLRLLFYGSTIIPGFVVLYVIALLIAGTVFLLA